MNRITHEDVYNAFASKVFCEALGEARELLEPDGIVEIVTVSDSKLNFHTAIYSPMPGFDLLARLKEEKVKEGFVFMHSRISYGIDRPISRVLLNGDSLSDCLADNCLFFSEGQINPESENIELISYRFKQPLNCSRKQMLEAQMTSARNNKDIELIFRQHNAFAWLLRYNYESKDETYSPAFKKSKIGNFLANIYLPEN